MMSKGKDMLEDFSLSLIFIRKKEKKRKYQREGDQIVLLVKKELNKWKLQNQWSLGLEQEEGHLYNKQWYQEIVVMMAIKMPQIKNQCFKEEAENKNNKLIHQCLEGLLYQKIILNDIIYI